mgnify:CR=1 FL=1
MFKRTTAINKILALSKRIKVIQGGTSAGKTYGIIPVLIDYAVKHQRSTITVVAESIPAVKNGALKIFIDVMVETNRYFEERYNASDRIYTFANKSTIQFTSFDSVGKAKAVGKRDVLFINEANHISYDIADALMIRSPKSIYIDYNPDEAFWVHNEVLKQDNAEFLLLKYTDNEALPPETLEDLQIKISKAFHNPKGNWNDKANIKSEYWRNWVRVYVEGLEGTLQGTIFNFNQVLEVPKEAELVAYGLDWGYTNDPSSLVAVYRYNKELFIEELIYEKRLTNSMIVERMKQLNIDKYKQIIADSAEPKSIADIQTLGYTNIQPALKGKDSIRNSIDILQSFTLNITERSTNLIKELRQYRWVTDKTGQQTNIPIDANNHCIDALRYVALNKLKNKGGFYF